MTANIELTCQKCDSKACVFYSTFEDHTNYCMCRNCGKVWREINGITPDVDEIVDEADMLDLLPLDPFEAYTEAAVRQDMLDYLFKCNVCGSLSFEIELGFYQCSNEDCGFEWED